MPSRDKERRADAVSLDLSFARTQPFGWRVSALLLHYPRKAGGEPETPDLVVEMSRFEVWLTRDYPDPRGEMIR
jgi:hypothetical protein